MGRTLRAVLLAAFIVFAVVAGLGVFLGFEAAASLIAGAVSGVIAGLLIWAAARRADSFHEREIPPVQPGFPGPPEHREAGAEPNGADEAGTEPNDHDEAEDPRGRDHDA